MTSQYTPATLAELRPQPLKRGDMPRQGWSPYLLCTLQGFLFSAQEHGRHR